MRLDSGLIRPEALAMNAFCFHLLSSVVWVILSHYLYQHFFLGAAVKIKTHCSAYNLQPPETEKINSPISDQKH